jgi:hypothetical protein
MELDIGDVTGGHPNIMLNFILTAWRIYKFLLWWNPSVTKFTILKHYRKVIELGVKRSRHQADQSPPR